MARLIELDALLAEIKKRLKFQQTCIKTGYRLTGRAEEEIIFEYNQLLSLLDTLEVKEVELTNMKTNWCPSNKQIDSLRDLLKYNIGVFDYQKFMEVNSLYEDLTKILDYETNRQK